MALQGKKQHDRGVKTSHPPGDARLELVMNGSS